MYQDLSADLFLLALGNLHYFALNVPSLRFVAAKFASEDYETLKALWSHTYEAIERKKRM